MRFKTMPLKIMTAALATSVFAIGLAHAGHHGGKHEAKPAAQAMQKKADGDIVDAAINSKVHTTLVAAVKAADLVDTLKSDGPFTVFAPTDAAFSALPAGTVETLLKPENKSQLGAVLTYHVVAGKHDSASILAKIKAGKGKATLTTVQGEALTATLVDGKVIVTDAKGGKSTVATADLRQSNGIIHVVDKVLLPKG